MKDRWGRTVSVETMPYEIANWTAAKGLKKPRGNGQWNFHFGSYSIGGPVSVDVSLERDVFKGIKDSHEAGGRCWPMFSGCLFVRGQDGKWIPLLPNGYCPACKNQEGHIEYKPENITPETTANGE